MNIPEVEVLIEEEKPQEKQERRGGKRPGAGRPSLVRLNKERMEQGLEPILPPKKKKIQKKVKSDATLPVSKKQRHQEILAEMLGRKSQYIVQKVLEKAMDDEDEDQMACLKIVMDRVLPADYFSKVKNKSSGITIQIMGVDAEINEVETVDAEFEDVES